MGQLGYRTVFLSCGLLALPGGVACCLAGGSVASGGDCDGNDGSFMENSCAVNPPYAEARQQDPEMFAGGIELVEGEDNMREK